MKQQKQITQPKNNLNIDQFSMIPEEEESLVMIIENDSEYQEIEKLVYQEQTKTQPSKLENARNNQKEQIQQRSNSKPYDLQTKV